MTDNMLPTGPAAPFDVHSFLVSGKEDASPDGRFAQWFIAENLGFHEPDIADEDYPKYVEAFAADARTLTGVHDPEQAAPSWDAKVPVATYGTMVNSLNVGGGAQLDAHLITGVTVRASHRRRGILRSVISDDLRTAAAAGKAVAALMASEATIYGRFGFGCATFANSIEVNVTERFAISAPRIGTTALVAPESAVETAEAVFARFQAGTLGSVGRQYSYARRASGRWGRERPVEDRGVRMAAHYDADGEAVGYVSYKFAGWDTTPYTMKVIDLVAATPEAYRELWRYLGDLDLVQRVTWGGARLDDPLPWALQDRRSYRVTGSDDVLWLRILDPAAALEARPYTSQGRLVLRVGDPLGIAAGTFEIETADGAARVRELDADAPADVELDVTALGSLYLGGVRAPALAAGGSITALTSGAVESLDALFHVPENPYCITHF